MCPVFWFITKYLQHFHFYQLNVDDRLYPNIQIEVIHVHVAHLSTIDVECLPGPELKENGVFSW